MRLGGWTAVCVVSVGLAAPVAATAREGSAYRPVVRGDAGVVATVSLASSKAAIAALDAGGNAADAAAAAVFAVGVTRPDLCGIGGGGFLTLRTPNGRIATLDYRETAPAQYTFTSGLFAPFDPGAFFGTGHGVAGVPGTVAGMAALLERYGRRSLAEAIEPARRLAEEGVRVVPQFAELNLIAAHRLRLYDASAQIYLKNGLLPHQTGDTLVQRDYAESLRLIQQGGPDAFYRGPIAQRIVAAMEASGLYPGDKGTVAASDLAGYRAIWRAPVRGFYRGAEIVGAPPPTSGPLFIVQALQILDGFDLPALERSSADAVHLRAEAEKLAWADRAAYVGDPAFVDVPLEWLTSREYAAQRRAEIDPAHARDPGAGASAADRAGHTTHVAVIDRKGFAVSATCTIEQTFGSAVVAPGTGFLLNNQLTDFDNVAGHPNAPQPGKRPRSSTSPMIAVKDGEAAVVIGGAGGPEIPRSTLDALVGVLDHGQDLSQAVDAERSLARGACGGGLSLCLEAPRFDRAVIDELAARGHTITERGEYASAVLNAVGTDLATGEHVGVTDPRGYAGGPDPAAGAALAQSSTARRSRERCAGGGRRAAKEPRRRRRACAR